MKPYPVCLGNISNDFTANEKKKTGLIGYLYDFSVDYNTIDICDINIHKYLMKKHGVQVVK